MNLFPHSLCHQCKGIRYILTNKGSIFLQCERKIEKYLPQPVIRCNDFSPAKYVQMRTYTHLTFRRDQTPIVESSGRWWSTYQSRCTLTYQHEKDHWIPVQKEVHMSLKPKERSYIGAALIWSDQALTLSQGPDRGRVLITATYSEGDNISAFSRVLRPIQQDDKAKTTNPFNASLTLELTLN